MRTIRLPALVLALAAAGCGRPPAVAASGTPPTATPPTAAATPPTASTLPGLYPRPAPPAVTAGDVPPALVQVFAERNRLHQRQTGASLAIAAQWVRDPRSEPYAHVWINWAIDYDGPRRPFAILTPKTGTGDNPAVAHFWCLKPDGTVATLSLTLAGGGPLGQQPPKQREAFSVSTDGRPVVGQLGAYGVRHLKASVGREPGPGEPPLWVQLEYAPTNRGDGFDNTLVDPITGYPTRSVAWTLDAWTGKLWSPVAEVVVK